VHALGLALCPGALWQGPHVYAGAAYVACSRHGTKGVAWLLVSCISACSTCAHGAAFIILTCRLEGARARTRTARLQSHHNAKAHKRRAGHALQTTVCGAHLSVSRSALQRTQCIDPHTVCNRQPPWHGSAMSRGGAHSGMPRGTVQGADLLQCKRGSACGHGAAVLHVHLSVHATSTLSCPAGGCEPEAGLRGLQAHHHDKATQDTRCSRPC